ncbi:hypothetical protein DXG01_008689 [Tephrocybe rancida]|nr:hypothetical protein DXG01_008689 [Tephrocybe rancida]
MVVDVGLCLYEHDLIAVVTTKPTPMHNTRDVEVHILQFSTGKPHPLALEPVLFVRKSNDLPATNVGIEIVGDYLALVTTPNLIESAARFCVFEWTTGSLLLDHTVLPDTYCSILFLSMTHLCLSNSTAGTLDIFIIPPSLQSSSKPVCRLALPLVSEGYGFRAIEGRSEPNPSPHGTSHSSIPFHPTSEDAIAIFNVHIRNAEGTAPRGDLTMFVHRAALLRLCESRGSDGETVDWEAWGPPVTRWMDTGAVPWWITTTTGQRCVLGATNMGPPPFIEILDFNPWTVKRTLGDGWDSELVEGRRSVHLEPSVISSEVFQSTVEGCLPYVSIARTSSEDMSFQFDGVLMDEERFLGLMLGDEGQVRAIQIFHIGSD